MTTSAQSVTAEEIMARYAEIWGQDAGKASEKATVKDTARSCSKQNSILDSSTVASFSEISSCDGSISPSNEAGRINLKRGCSPSAAMPTRLIEMIPTGKKVAK